MSDSTPEIDPRYDQRRIKATEEEMQHWRIPIPYRDSCVHLLIPLNKCRLETFYLPWKCTNERHAYERCEYKEYLRRVRDKMVKEGKLEKPES